MSRYYRAALACARAGDLCGAARLARAALAADGESEGARRLLGLCLYESGDLATALPYLENTDLAEDVKRELAKTREAFARAAGHVQKGKWRKALRELIPLRESARVLSARGCVCACAGRHALAEAYFARALAADKGCAARYLGALPAARRFSLLSFFRR